MEEIDKLTDEETIAGLRRHLQKLGDICGFMPSRLFVSPGLFKRLFGYEYSYETRPKVSFEKIPVSVFDAEGEIFYVGTRPDKLGRSKNIRAQKAYPELGTEDEDKPRYFRRSYT